MLHPDLVLHLNRTRHELALARAQQQADIERALQESKEREKREKANGADLPLAPEGSTL